VRELVAELKIQLNLSEYPTDEIRAIFHEELDLLMHANMTESPTYTISVYDDGTMHRFSK
jgi:hypothetical protein